MGAIKSLQWWIRREWLVSGPGHWKVKHNLQKGSLTPAGPRWWFLIYRAHHHREKAWVLIDMFQSERLRSLKSTKARGKVKLSLFRGSYLRSFFLGRVMRFTCEFLHPCSESPLLSSDSPKSPRDTIALHPICVWCIWVLQKCYCSHLSLALQNFSSMERRMGMKVEAD